MVKRTRNKQEKFKIVEKKTKIFELQKKSELKMFLKNKEIKFRKICEFTDAERGLGFTASFST